MLIILTVGLVNYTPLETQRLLYIVPYAIPCYQFTNIIKFVKTQTVKYVDSKVTWATFKMNESFRSRVSRRLLYREANSWLCHLPDEWGEGEGGWIGEAVNEVPPPSVRWGGGSTTQSVKNN